MTVQGPGPVRPRQDIRTVVASIELWLRANRSAPGSTGAALTPEQAAFIAEDAARGVSAADFSEAYLEISGERRGGYVELAAVRARAKAKARARKAGAVPEADRDSMAASASARSFMRRCEERGLTRSEIDQLQARDHELSRLGWRRPIVEHGRWGARLECGHVVHAIPDMDATGRARHCDQCKQDGAPSSWKKLAKRAREGARS